MHFLATLNHNANIFLLINYFYNYFCDYKINVMLMLIHNIFYTAVLCQVHCCHVNGWVYHRPW